MALFCIFICMPFIFYKHFFQSEKYVTYTKVAWGGQETMRASLIQRVWVHPLFLTSSLPFYKYLFKKKIYLFSGVLNGVTVVYMRIKSLINNKHMDKQEMGNTKHLCLNLYYFSFSTNK